MTEYVWGIDLGGTKIEGVVLPSAESTDAVCNEACNIWQAACLFDFETCTAECKAEGDWGGLYLECLRNNADDCFEIETTCEAIP